MLIETFMLISIVIMVISIMVVLTVEILHTTKNIAKKRCKNKDSKIISYSDLYR